jgi:hypothetical protein
MSDPNSSSEDLEIEIDSISDASHEPDKLTSWCNAPFLDMCSRRDTIIGGLILAIVVFLAISKNF